MVLTYSNLKSGSTITFSIYGYNANSNVVKNLALFTFLSLLSHVLNDSILAANVVILTYTLEPLLKLIVATRELG